MNIFIIGNGFDLAHGLPTKYKDFLSYVQVINQSSTSQSALCSLIGNSAFKSLSESVQTFIKKKYMNIEKLKESSLSNIFVYTKDKYTQEILDKSRANFWFDYFNSLDTLIKENWIDFEKEIADVIKIIDSYYKKCLVEGIPKNELYNLPLLLRKLFIKNQQGEPLNRMIDEKHYTQIFQFDFKLIIKQLNNDLQNLIRCLEIYLEDCVKNIKITALSSNIYYHDFNRVLSFNYTNTFQRIYENKYNVEYDYIHGKAKIDNFLECNIVLGIDEYLDEDAKNKDVSLIQFKKYYQRIHKKTGCKYKDWLKEIKSKKDKKHDVYIFGHSLDVTDKDILNEIIMCDNVYTTIFYLNTEVYGTQISNLVNVIGQDNLIQKVYGESKSIEFIQQQDMTNFDFTDWQIMRDIKKLWSSHDLSNKEYDKLLNRIDTMISNHYNQYFSNQRNIISLFDALSSNKQNQYKENLLEIAKNLFKEYKLVQYDYKDWGDCDVFGMHECGKKTFDFISNINDSNKTSSLKYNFFEELAKSIETECKNTEELAEAIILNDVNECVLHSVYKKTTEFLENGFEDAWKCIVSALWKATPEDRETFFMNINIDENNELEKIRVEHLIDINDECN